MTDLPDLDQLRRLPLFPADGGDPARFIFWAAVHAPTEISPERLRFLRASYLRALRRAQGWDPDA